MLRSLRHLTIALLALILAMLAACEGGDDSSRDSSADSVETTDTVEATDTTAPPDTEPTPVTAQPRDTTAALEVGSDGTNDDATILPCEEACTEAKEDPCIAACWGSECGNGGVEGCLCGEFEGGCPDNSLCEYGLCTCPPDPCSNAECGDDGCGGSCGDCGDLGYCEDGICTCLPFCEYPPTVWGELLKVDDLVFYADGLAGHGLDIDGDPTTCAPAGNCEDGIDNSLGSLKATVIYETLDGELENGLADGSLILLGESLGLMTDGTGFVLNLYLGDLADPDSSCDVQTETCEYVIDPMSFDEGTHCPLVSFDNCTIDGTELSCGGEDDLFVLFIPVIEDVKPLTLVVHKARLEAQVALEGDVITSATGLIGGAIPAKAFEDAIFDLSTCMTPGDIDTCTVEVGGTSLPATVVRDLITTAVTWDIDIDGDGILDESDAASLGLGFGMIPGTLVEPFIAAE